MKHRSKINSRWLVRINCPEETAQGLHKLLRMLGDLDATCSSQVPCIIFTTTGVPASMEVLWAEKPIHETNCLSTSSSSASLKCSLSLDHVALCSPQNRRGGCLEQLSASLGEWISDNIRDLESIRAKVAFLSVGHGGIDINLISPRVEIPHLSAFLGLQAHGGVLHIGLAVSNMERALEACRQAGIDTLAERIAELMDQCALPENDALRALVETGYTVEPGVDGLGYLRQTFAFPWKERGAPFIEFVERQSFNGYGEASSPLLLGALDLVYCPAGE